MAIVKRIILIALAILLLLVAAGWGYWTYRQYRAGQTMIPRDATSVVRVHVDGILRDIAWNALRHGTSYRDTAASHPAFRTKMLQDLHMPIPASVFLYQVGHGSRNEFPDVYFGSLAVDDSTGMAAWLHDNLGMDITAAPQGTVASSSHALVVIQPGRALLALSPKKLGSGDAGNEALVDVLIGILDAHGGSLAITDSPFADILADDGQLAGRGSRAFSIGFEAGKITFSAPNALAHPLSQLQPTPHFADSNAVSLWVQDSLTGFLAGRSFDIGGHKLQGDSLLRHYGGRMAMEWKGTVMQQDTVVNFDYDDNFELVETQEIMEKPVPEVYWSLQADTALMSYLQGRGIVEESGSAVTREAFPLYKMGASPLPTGYLQFHTAPTQQALPAPTDDGEPLSFYLRINFNRLQIPDLPARLAPLMQAANLLEVSAGQPASAHGATMHGTLQLKDGQLHSLVQLLKLI